MGRRIGGRSIGGSAIGRNGSAKRRIGDRGKRIGETRVSSINDEKTEDEDELSDSPNEGRAITREKPRIVDKLEERLREKLVERDQGTGQISRIETPNSERRPGIKLIRSLVSLARLQEAAEQDTQAGQRRNRNDAREAMNETNSHKTAALV